MKKLSLLGGCYHGARKVFIIMFWKNMNLKLRHYIQVIMPCQTDGYNVFSAASEDYADVATTTTATTTTTTTTTAKVLPL
jgi:hypothetical protein